MLGFNQVFKYRGLTVSYIIALEFPITLTIGVQSPASGFDQVMCMFVSVATFLNCHIT